MADLDSLDDLSLALGVVLAAILRVNPDADAIQVSEGILKQIQYYMTHKPNREDVPDVRA